MSRWAFTIRLYTPVAYLGRLAVVAALNFSIITIAGTVNNPGETTEPKSLFIRADAAPNQDDIGAVIDHAVKLAQAGYAMETEELEERTGYRLEKSEARNPNLETNPKSEAESARPAKQIQNRQSLWRRAWQWLMNGDAPGHPFRGNQWMGGVPDMSEAEIQANIQRGRNAMWECLSEQKDITAAMMRPDIGDVDFVWDRNGRGIKHILERRAAELKARPDQFALGPEETLQKLVEVIARGRATMRTGQWHLEHEGYEALLAKASQKRNAWLITGFQTVKKGERR